jgi:hypothetical protein
MEEVPTNAIGVRRAGTTRAAAAIERVRERESVRWRKKN